MENDLIDLKGKKIEVEISGCSFHRGILIDSGVDIIVLYNGKNNYFYYIPFVHIQRLKEIGIQEDALYDPPLKKPIETEALSFRKIVTIAKGLFVQVYVTENKSFHGY